MSGKTDRTSTHNFLIFFFTMNRPHAIGTLLVRMENNNGSSNPNNVAMETAKTSARRRWWSMMGNKEDQFVWDGSSSRNEDILYKPNFEHDAGQTAVNSSMDHAEEGSVDDITIKEAKQRVIDQRIDKLSSLFTTRRSVGFQHHNTRATDLTDDEFIDIVLNKNQNTENHVHQSMIAQNGTKQILQNYQECRERRRDLATTYIADRRSFLPEPWMERDDGEQSSVQMDRHGRLVQIRRDNLNNDAETDNDAAENSTELELVDATAVFWRQHMKANEKNGQTGRGRLTSSISNVSIHPPLPLILRPQPPPLPQNPIQQQQHVRERNIALQMENESRQAIERAIHRYRREQQQEQHQEGAVFEMIDIPLIRPINEVNAPRRFRFLPFRRQQRVEQQQQRVDNNNVAGNLNHEQIQQQIQQQDDERDWVDIRLALRRICVAVITVVAAFICMMLQGLPVVDFGDDGMELHPIILSGLMGPHYPGYHSQQDHYRQVLNMQIAQEEGATEDMQQSIWNRLGIDESFYLSSDIILDEAAQSNDDRGEL